MREYLKNMKISFFLAAILYIVLGLVLLIWPGITSSLVCFSFGLMLLIYGIITIISFFVHDSRQGSFRLELFLGIVAAGVGLVFLLRPDIVLSILPVVLGIYIVIDSLLNLKRALDLNRMNYSNWWVVLVLSLVSAALGVLIPVTSTMMSLRLSYMGRLSSISAFIFFSLSPPSRRGLVLSFFRLL